ncbi:MULTISPECIES: hypothetical protein [Alphaproteobacteria]|uniref:Peptidase M50 n=2 Tax=Alphaproteobacteria TaxID=28211 RepID=A0A512HDB8_9HYPH|nr:MULTISPECIES: hypothetical protein [Alphaproteobacteria]GEO83435.1 peptidase M50 [Ciceribacter naphthalenivorans]GLR22992.1 peptidase M50 [Ciceribacter naphthalenivorans]GLT05848.1 peptidase M50 [Sphingomonas psychrolutea]
MTTFQAAVILLGINLGLIWLLMAAPLGVRTLRVIRKLDRRPEELWNIARHGGGLADWHPAIASVRRIDGLPDRLELLLRDPDHSGQPIVRTLAIDRTGVTAEGEFSCDLRIVADSALDAEFWSRYREVRRVCPADGGSTVMIEQTDNYRGLGSLLYRYLLLGREMTALENHLNGRVRTTNGRLAHAFIQAALAALSTLLLWPFFGLDRNGLMISTFLTLVIVFHELGHMVAFRAFGHASTRMIFVPLLGGIAIGGRPYDSRFEVATCALMGAGVSAFIVPILIAIQEAAESGALPESASAPLLVLLLILSAFNLLNLLPTHRFDGGQVLRQLFPSQTALALSTFTVTAAIVWTGWRIGLSPQILIAGLAVFSLLSLIRSRKIKPHHSLTPMTAQQRLLTGFGLCAALAIHAGGIIHAAERLFTASPL